MRLARVSTLLFTIVLAGSRMAQAQGPQASGTDPSAETLWQLLQQLKSQDLRLKELEAEVSELKAEQYVTGT